MPNNIDKSFIKEIIEKNIEGIVVFTERLLHHDGKVNISYLHRVKESDDKFSVSSMEEKDKLSDLCILMGGEVPNSFSPLYEMAYFFQAWFLAGIGTFFVKKYGMLNDEASKLDIKSQISHDVLTLDEEELWENLKKPIVSIICSLDTDIEPYRYVKHQLWRLDEGCFKKRCSEVRKDEFGFSIADESLKNIYWVEEDRQIAETAMANAEEFGHAKAIQYYLTIRKFLEYLNIDHLNIDLAAIPLYFNFVPREEFMALGPDNEVFQTLIALHDKKFLKFFSKLIRQQYPWIISTSCPKCGESSKRIISSRIKGDGKTVRAKCSPNVKIFRNEAGISVERKGCGHSFEFKVPDDPHELYEFCKNHSFTVNFPVRELVIVIKTTADSPVCWPVTEIGVRKDCKGRLYTVNDLPKGFGDHLALLTSMVTLQYFMIRGLIVPDLVRDFQKSNVLTKKEMLILANVSDTSLEDKMVTSKGNNNIYVKDTSALKALKNGLRVEEFFKLSVDIHPFTPEDLLKLKV